MLKTYSFCRFFFVSPRFSERNLDRFPFLPSPPSGTRFRLLNRSDKFVWILLIATPSSSAAKSKPRSTETRPVDMSVLLADRRSMEGRGLSPGGSSVAKLLVDERERRDTRSLSTREVRRRCFISVRPIPTLD